MIKRSLFLSIGISALLLLQFSPKVTALGTSANKSSAAVSRLAGADRYETSILISQSGWSHAACVILATGEDYPDALSASALSKFLNAPILLTGSDSLSYSLTTELKRLGTLQVTLIGGTGVIKPLVESELNHMGITVTRIGGIDRYDTSKQIANLVGVKDEVAVATGENFPDALSIAPIAAMRTMPILLSRKTGFDIYMTDVLKNRNISHSYIIGGTGVLGTVFDSSLPNSKRLFGSDRYRTNLAVNTEFASSLNFNTVYLATGQDFPDALSGSSLAAQSCSPILLTEKDYISPETINLMKSKNVKNVVILGGTGAVSKNVENLINASLSTDGNVDITSSFTDPNFKLAVYKLIGKASPSPILYSDVKNITDLDVHESNLKDLNGIEFFTSLKNLNCFNNQLTYLDVSHNSALTKLNCGLNMFTSLDVSHNTGLTFLMCNGNRLQYLDVSHNTALTDLWCGNNTLTALDVVNNAALTNLNCEYNKIKALDVTKNSYLKFFLCAENCLTTLDISKNKNLADPKTTPSDNAPDILFGCQGNEIKTLYASNNNYNPIDYRPQYTDSTHTKTTNDLNITIKN